MTKKQDASVSKLREKAAALKAAKRAADKATRERDAWIKRCVEAGVSPAEVARVAGVSRGRVSQLAPVPKAPPARVYAGKNSDAPLRVNDPDTVPSLPDTVPMLSGSASTRQRKPYGRVTVFKEPAPVPALLSEVPDGLASCRIFLTGPRPLDPDAGGSQAEQVRAWALADPGPGWSAESHYLADAVLPVLRFKHDDGRRVTILRAAAWWGETDADLATCRAAWDGLASALDAVPAFAGAGLADTPATTGRALWLRTIPEGKSYPVLSDEVRELIHTTAGQGRIELRPEPITEPPASQNFTYLDGRFMYSALVWGMPVGEPARWTGEAIDQADAATFTRAMRGRSRWRVTVTVPDGWAHVGLLMCPDGNGGWCYPNKPGQTFTTWADGSELWTAMEYGWDRGLVFHEGLTWDEGKPLDAWHKALLGVWEKANASEAPAAKLAARAVRSLVLFTIGAFATGGTRPVTRSTTDPDKVPAGVEVRRVGESLVWTEQTEANAWTLQTAHPEWSATVWARARTRLLTARGVDQQRVGALHLPPESIVAFSTDALYLAGGNPGWADDGKPGRFRVKGMRPGAFTWPETYADLYKLRDESEAAR